MENKKLEKILLVEDNEKYRKAARDVITKKYSHFDTKENLEEALPIYENYDFVLIDGFFPVAKKFGKKQASLATDFLDKIGDSGEKNMGMNYMLGVMLGEDNAPLGLYLAEKLKNEGINNYLIVTAADHHVAEYGLMRNYSSAKNLNLFIEDLVRSGNSKDKKEYWENALIKMEEIYNSNSKSLKGGKENGKGNKWKNRTYFKNS